MKLITLFLFVLAVAGCARDKVIVDKQGVDPVRYEQDKAECETYADEVSTGKKAVGSAVGGAVIGAAIGAVLGNSGTAGRLAGVGGVVGGAKGAGEGQNEKEQVLRNCLRGRGYKVLN